MKRHVLVLSCLSLASLVTSVASCGGDDTTYAPKDGGGGGAFDVTVPPGVDASDASDLPPVTGHQSITGLKGPVDVMRDKYGMIHIYAQTAEDAFRVQGYQVSKDRTAQLEILRRSATGRLAELFGDQAPSLIDSDIAIRTVGLGRVGKQMYDALAPGSDLKNWIDAYVDGINQFNTRVNAGQEHYPDDMFGLKPAAFAPWTGADVLAVGRFQSFNLGYQGDDEIGFTQLVEATRAKFAAASADPNLAKRAGFLNDVLRFAPIDPTTVLLGLPNDTTHTGSARAPGAKAPAAKVQSPRVSSDSLAATKGFTDAIKAVRHLIGDKAFTGSNNWVVGPSLTASGHALLASDPHLSLSAPSVFWMVHINVSDPKAPLDFSGLSFPGIPAIILGMNENIAWGATTADYDVTDVYKETLTADGSGVVFNGQPVPFTKVRETIAIAGGGSYDYDVLIVPHHGPIVPNIAPDHTVKPPLPGPLSIRWTGHQPTHELDAVAKLVQAKSVEDARTAFRSFEVGAQNWVVADTHGDIFYTSQSQIPLRDKRAYTWTPATYSGTLPCLVLPGDGTAEWTGKFLDEAFVPHIKNPPKSYVGTANGDQYGGTLDNDPSNDVLPTNDPIYTACFHDPGFRVGRVHQRIETVGHPITVDDMATFQADARSATGSNLAPRLLATITNAEAEKATPGSHPDLSALVADARYSPALITEVKTALTAWGTDSDYDAAAGVSLDDDTPVSDAKEATASKATAIFNAWLVRMTLAVFDDEVAAVGAGYGGYDFTRGLLNVMLPDPTTLKTYDATLKDSILFDDMTTAAVVETRDQRALLSLLDALDFLKAKLGADTGGWRWGKLHRLRFSSLVSSWPTLSIPAATDPVFPNGFPRHGDGYNIDVGGYGFGSTLAATTFHYAHGPTQRFVVEMTPSGPVARNALPGGEIWNSTSTHFRDEAERWRRNQNRPVPFTRGDVISAAEDHILWTTP
jgi:penicillin G amidase